MAAELQNLFIVWCMVYLLEFALRCFKFDWFCTLLSAKQTNEQIPKQSLSQFVAQDCPQTVKLLNTLKLCSWLFFLPLLFTVTCIYVWLEGAEFELLVVSGKGFCPVLLSTGLTNLEVTPDGNHQWASSSYLPFLSRNVNQQHPSAAHFWITASQFGHFSVTIWPFTEQESSCFTRYRLVNWVWRGYTAQWSRCFLWDGLRNGRSLHQC